MQPTAHMSTALVYSHHPTRISGALYHLVVTYSVIPDILRSLPPLQYLICSVNSDSIEELYRDYLPCKTEIGYLELAVRIDQYVPRLEVSVYDVAAVDIF